MKTKARLARSRMARRVGFTLIELMVVITIIVALMALSASAAMKFIEVQQNNNTQSTLDRTQSQLGKAWSKVKDQAYKETIPPAISTWIQTNLAGSDANAAVRIRVIYVKLKLRQAFPMNFDEALNLATANTGNLQSPLPALPAYQTYLNTELAIFGSSVPPASYESSACLLMALQRGVSGAGINPSQLTTGGATGSFTTPSGSNLPYLTDAWSRPIYFARFPTGCPVLNPAGALVGANDPGDPMGYLNSTTWATTMPQGQQWFSWLTAQQLAPASNPPLSYKLAPMVASGGPTNWVKTGQLTFHPTTFQPGYYTLTTGVFSPSTLGTGVFYSNP